MYTDVMSKVPDNVMKRGEDEVKKIEKNGQLWFKKISSRKQAHYQ